MEFNKVNEENASQLERMLSEEERLDARLFLMFFRVILPKEFHVLCKDASIEK